MQQKPPVVFEILHSSVHCVHHLCACASGETWFVMLVAKQHWQVGLGWQVVRCNAWCRRQLVAVDVFAEVDFLVVAVVYAGRFGVRKAGVSD